MNVETWKIQPTGLSGLHLGRHGIEQEHSSVLFSSDSLFSALTAAVAQLDGEEGVERWMASLPGDDPPFLLTSAFPYAGEVRFYPAPQLGFTTGVATPGVDTVRPKDLKKIRFVSEGAFKALVDGSQSLAGMVMDAKCRNGEFLWLPSESAHLPEAVSNRKQPIVTSDERPRVLIDRVSNASALFFTGFVQFAPNCGLWFGVRWRKMNTALRQQFQEGVQLLESSGIGGERNAGYGQVAIEAWDAVEMPDPTGKSWVSLSRYLPREDEMPALREAFAAYQLEGVGGWLQSTGSKAERRRTVNMLKEGAVLGALPKDWAGQIADVQPDYNGTKPIGHPVYRSGLALGVGLTIGGTV
ncbi:MAG: type III-A CRISPR-associated RAMP protein Csm4 [Anaerolineae bacterium]|nr:type III-A CRISPR-associated RAMP protein Csm4 [Anaerolineae bacterium]